MLKRFAMAAALAAGLSWLPGATSEAGAAMGRVAAPPASSAVTLARYHGGGRYVSVRPVYRHHYYNRRPGIYLYGGLPLYSYSYGGSHCAWLYNRAVSTGSRYWWRRYRYECG